MGVGPHIKRLHLDTKALAVLNEYLRVRRDFASLAAFADALANDRNELGEIIRRMGEIMAASAYRRADVDYLVQHLRQALSARLQQRPQAAQGGIRPTERAPRPAADPAARTPLPNRRPAGRTIAPPVRGEAERPAQGGSALQRAQAKGRGGALRFTRDPANRHSSPPPSPVAPRPASQPPRPVKAPPKSPRGGADAFGASSVSLNLDGLRQYAYRPTVLIAEDDPRTRMVYHMKLEEDGGYNVLDAMDGQEAWQMIQNSDISAVILDIKMPKVNGLELLQRMRKQKPVLPVVLVTSFDHVKDEFAVQTYPRLKYLVKPVVPEKIIESLRELGVVPK
jgi:CheY-like chemotaxis protein